MESRTEATSRRSAKLLALLLLAVSLASSSSDVRTNHDQDSSVEETSPANVDEEPEGGSRSASGGEYVNSVPPWLMPMFGARTCTDIDGHICGIGVRVRGEYFLASNRAMAEVNLGLNRSNSPFGAPGVFKFNAPLEIDISQINKDGWQWAPQHVKTYQGDIGLYRAAVRSSARHDVASNVQWIPEAKDRHPLATPVRLETELNKSLSPCKLLTYGAKEGASKGITSPIRKLTAIRVEKVSCDGNHVCRMTRSSNIADKKADRVGALCGSYSDLGAPILCGEGSQETVKFIVGQMPAHLWSSGSGKCDVDFKALEVAGYAREILRDIETDAVTRSKTPTEPPKSKNPIDGWPVPVVPTENTEGTILSAQKWPPIPIQPKG